MKPTDCDALYRDGRHYDLQHREFVEDIPFYVGHAKSSGGPVLELACGTGRITIPVAAEGVDITGLDVSETMLGHAKRKAEAQGVAVEWVLADFRDFHLGRQFGLVLFPFNSIAHLHDLADIDACFSCVREHLSPDGRFIVDIFNPRLEILIRDPSERYPVDEYSDPDGRGTVVVTENNVYDRATQMNRIKWYYKIGRKREEEVADLNMRIFFPQELDALLIHNGFTIEDKFGAFDGAPFSSISATQVVLCRPA
jgi:SAM-dependent methyltransferase